MEFFGKTVRAPTTSTNYLSSLYLLVPQANPSVTGLPASELDTISLDV